MVTVTTPSARSTRSVSIPATIITGDGLQPVPPAAAATDRLPVRGRRLHRGGPPPGVGGGTGPEVEVRRVQPYQAVKRYLCAGCNHMIERGTGHLVVVPLDAPDLRRHWHHACWRHRDQRRAGRV